MTEFGLNGEINPFNIISFLNIFEGNIKEKKNECKNKKSNAHEITAKIFI